MDDLPDTDHPFHDHRLAPSAMDRDRMLSRARAAWAAPVDRPRGRWKPWALAAAASLLLVADALSSAWCRAAGTDRGVEFAATVVAARAVPPLDATDEATRGIEDRRTSRLARLFPAEPDGSAQQLILAKLDYRNLSLELP